MHSHIRTLAFSTLLLTCGLSAQDWNVDASGNWGTAANWNPAVVPNAVGATANFLGVITANRAVTLDISPTAGVLMFMNPNSYFILPSGANSLTLSNVGTSTITITQGSHTINAPLTLNSNLMITNTGGTFTLGGNVSGPSTFTLSSGPLVVNAALAYTGSTFINGGTLTIGSSGALANGQNLTVASGASFITSDGIPDIVLAELLGGGSVDLMSNVMTLAIANDNPVFSGNIAGINGTLVVDSANTLNPGTMTLSGNNTYELETIIRNATLSVSSDQNLGAAVATLSLGDFSTDLPTLLTTGSVTTKRIFDVVGTTSRIDMQGNHFVHQQPGNASGSGALHIGNTLPGIYEIQVTYNYTGGTFVDSGTLLLTTLGAQLVGNLTLAAGTTFDISGASSQSIGFLTGNGNTNLGGHALSVMINAPTTYSGNISGTGGDLLVGGTSTWSDSGINSYTGFTEVGGTLAIVGPGISAPNAAMIVDAGGTFDISGATNNQEMGTLSGAGTITLGTKELTHNGTNSVFSGAINGTGLFLQNAGTLSLTGISTAPVQTTPGATLKGTGTIGPLVNIGTTQPGNSAIGTLTVNGSYTDFGTLAIELNAAGMSSVLNVTGANFTIEPGTILLLMPDPGTYPPSQTYTVATFPSGTRTGTYTTVESTMPNRFPVVVIYDPHDIRVELGVIPFSNIIIGGNAGQVAKCIETIPQGAGTDGETIINALNFLSNDLSKLKSALNQLQPSQMAALALAQENNDILVRSALTQRFWYRLTRPKPKKEEVRTIRNNSVWFEPVGKYANQQKNQQNFGYRQATGGAVFGADSRLGGNFYLGSGFAYTFTNLDWKKNAGKALINSYYATLYGLWFTKRAFIDASMIGSYNHYHADRHIHFSTIDRKANSEHSGYQLAGSLGFGFFFNPNQVQLQPYARADYIYTHERGFREHGAQAVDLVVDKKSSRFIRTDLGLRLARDYQFENGNKLIPYAKLSWVYEQQLDHGHYTTHFDNSTCEMHVIGLHPIRSLFAPSFGVTTLAYDDALSFSLHCDFEFGSKFWETRYYLNFGYKY